MAANAKGEIVDGRVRDVLPGGEAVVETSRGIVMVRGALPAERLRLRIGRKASGVYRGELVELLEQSSERVTAECPLADHCGGCPLMALALPAQIAFKRERFSRALASVGYALAPEWIESPATLAYRTRARLFWQTPRGGGAAALGYRAAGTESLVPVEHCAVLAPPLQAGYRCVCEGLAPVLQGHGELMLGLGSEQRCVVELVASGPQPEAVYRACELLASQAELAGVSLRIGGGSGRSVAATWGDPRQVAQAVDGQPLLAPAGSFSQANAGVNRILVERVCELAEAKGARVLELYAGHGNLSVALGREAKELRAVEADADAARACQENLRARGLSHVRVVAGDAAASLAGRAPVDVVVLDPPRSGASAVIAGVLARRPSRIVYVSCDVSSLRRDLTAFCAGGYALDAAIGLDMFPHTGHFESIVRLAR